MPAGLSQQGMSFGTPAGSAPRPFARKTAGQTFCPLIYQPCRLLPFPLFCDIIPPAWPGHPSRDPKEQKLNKPPQKTLCLIRLICVNPCPKMNSKLQPRTTNYELNTNSILYFLSSDVYHLKNEQTKPISSFAKTIRSYSTTVY